MDFYFVKIRYVSNCSIPPVYLWNVKSTKLVPVP